MDERAATHLYTSIVDFYDLLYVILLLLQLANDNLKFQGENKIKTVYRQVRLISTGFFGRKLDCSTPTHPVEITQNMLCVVSQTLRYTDTSSGVTLARGNI